MTHTQSLLDACAAAGLLPSFDDAWGQHRDVPEETLTALLKTLAQEATDSPSFVPPVAIVWDGDLAPHVAVSLPQNARGHLVWQLTLEDGGSRDGKSAAAACASSGRLALPTDMPWGYHRLAVRWVSGKREQVAETTVVVAPRRCFRPPSLEGDGRRWGISIQLYAVRSAHNWGIGDFTDLITLLRGANRLGAACIGLNPLHALFPDDPAAASPYSPNSRLFLNTLYIDVEAIDDIENHTVARRIIDAPDFQSQLAEVRRATLIDYDAVARMKEKLLRVLYGTFCSNVLSLPDHPRAKAFRAFQERHGRPLRHFSKFLAGSSAIGEIEYHEYLQWQADLQLAKAQDVARRLGLSIGLYQDLAVGISPGGADAGTYRDALIADVSVGAPPDILNLSGQNWGLAAFNPHRLRALAYSPIRELLSSVMRRGGALRIDHILGFLRLYLIPDGMSAKDGAYLTYPWHDLLAILALESHRNRCLVIGEDLGTVPQGLREDLAAAGVLTMRVFYFEKQNDTAFLPTAAYPQEAMVTVGTHDLPTLAAFWSNADLTLRTQLDLWPTPEHCTHETRARAVDHVAAAQFAGVPADTPAPPVIPLYARLAETPSRLLMVQLEDMAGQTAQMNVPGTWRQYPNWRVRYAPDIEVLFTSTDTLALAHALAQRSDLPVKLGAHPVAGEGPAVPEVPRATYRVQFSPAFTFDDAVRIAPYLSALGISHLYASPWLKSRTGSTHGYDIVDHTVINPELGGAAGFENLSLVLRSYGIGHILDFVPNHMGVSERSNALWQSVLQGGRSAPAAKAFDIAWHVGIAHLRNRVLLPVLGEHYGDALARGAFAVRFDAANGRFSVWYQNQAFPLSPATYPALLLAAGDADLTKIADDFAQADAMPSDPDAWAAKIEALQAKLAMFVHERPEAADALRAAADSISGTADPDALHAILERQHYRLAHWAAAADEINYRRFFNINDLAGIRVENARLFSLAHSLVARLMHEGKIHGLRIDHVDGLFDPEAYCRDLRALTDKNAGRSDFYIVVEKILAVHERLRSTWPIQGTTGYGFITQLAGLLVDGHRVAAMDRAYHRFIDDASDLESVLAESKAQVLETMFHAELRVLMHRLHRLAQRHWRSSDYTRESLRAALRAVIMHFPVYRTYVGESIATEDRRDIDWAVARAAKAWRAPGRDVLAFVRDVITGDLARTDSGYPAKAVLRFARQFQQFTSPIMAKSLEDTAFYRYHRLIALNEVGGDPRQFGATVAAFHAQNRERARLWPASLLATSTHDTKRGEDTRARLLALPDIATNWSQQAAAWAKVNARHKTEIDGRLAPDRNDEYLLYQTLIGAWPIEMMDNPSSGGLRSFAARVRAVMIKAVREAKQKSSWDNPNTEYETALETFVDRILDMKFGRAFLQRFLPLARQLARLGLANTLAQTVLKLTVPGVPDFYQGAELWDLTLVDPDNRRSVHYNKRMQLVAALKGAGKDVSVLQETWHDGRLKLHVILRLLALRRDDPSLFASGSYEPVVPKGMHDERVCIFLRQHRASTIAVVVARHPGAFTQGAGDITEISWADTCISLPSGRWRDVLTNKAFVADGLEPTLISDLLAALPVAVLLATAPEE